MTNCYRISSNIAEAPPVCRVSPRGAVRVGGGGLTVRFARVSVGAFQQPVQVLCKLFEGKERLQDHLLTPITRSDMEQ